MIVGAQKNLKLQRLSSEGRKTLPTRMTAKPERSDSSGTPNGVQCQPADHIDCDRLALLVPFHLPRVLETLPSRTRLYEASEFVVSALKKIWALSLLAIAILAIQFLAILPITPAFAEASPGYGNTATYTQTGDQPIQLAQANLPSIGSVDDYMHQEGDGPSNAPSSPRYSPQSLPPPGYAPQGAPGPQWNNRYSGSDPSQGYYGADPNQQRNLLIGAAVVGAIAVGMWAYRQHEIQQAQKRARRRYYGRRYGYIE
jgi:hypothetical protein